MEQERSNIFIWAIGFLLLQAAIRLLLSPSLQADEAEIVLSSQTLNFGYDDHPPLYAWLYAGLSNLLGIHSYSLALLKYGLLGMGVYQAYRLLLELGNARQAEFAILAYLFFWQIMPKMQIDYTHSVLLLALTLWYIRRLLLFLDEPGWGRFAFLALVAGIGLLVKPNFALVFAASLLASIWDAEYRKTLLPTRILLLPLAAVSIASPYFLWLLQSGTHALTGDATSGFSLLAGLKSLSMFGGTVLANFLPFTIIGAIALRKSNPEKPWRAILTEELPPGRRVRLLQRIILVGLLLFAAAVFISNLDSLKERYLLPLDILLPITFTLFFRIGLASPGFRFMRQAAALMACLLLLFNLNEIIKPHISDKADSLNLPYRDLAPQLLAQGFEDGENILLLNHLYGGNLRVVFPHSRVITQRKNFTSPDDSRKTMLVWIADRYGKENWDQPEIPPDLLEFARHYFKPSCFDQPVRYAEAPYYYYPKKRFKLGMMILPEQCAG